MKTRDLEERVQRLRYAEQQCYSVCLYLLQDEALAIAAAQQTLIELFRQDSPSLQPSEVKKIAMKQSLAAAGGTRNCGKLSIMT